MTLSALPLLTGYASGGWRVAWAANEPSAETALSYTAPPMVVRSQTRYFSNSGNDQNNGLTPATALRDVWKAIRSGKLVNDTNVLFVGSDFDCLSRSLIDNASSAGRGTLLPTQLTFAPASGVWRSTTIHGPKDSGNAMDIWPPETAAGDGVLNWQVWGLGFTGWHGTGVFSVTGRTESLSFDGLYLNGNARPNTNQDHDFYLSGDHDSPTRVPNDIRIRGCTSEENANAGYFFHSYNGGKSYSATNVLIEGNSVVRSGNGGLLLTQSFIRPTTWTIRNNDIRLHGANAVLKTGEPQVAYALYFYIDSPAGYADRTMKIENNLFALLDARPNRFLRTPSAAAANPKTNSTPTSTNNRFYIPPGFDAYHDYVPGNGDRVIKSLPPQMVVAAPPPAKLPANSAPRSDACASRRSRRAQATATDRCE